MRRPDPCIYSQGYLEAQGFPVTWNIGYLGRPPKRRPNVIAPDSYHLEEKTDYIVFAAGAYASTDPAIGVRVRLVYPTVELQLARSRPGGGRRPGHECSGSSTSAMGAPSRRSHGERRGGSGMSHFCLQAILSHPMDVNVANNLGQENTQIFDTDGQAARIGRPAPNPARVAQRLHGHGDRVSTLRRQRPSSLPVAVQPRPGARSTLSDASPRSCPGSISTTPPVPMSPSRSRGRMVQAVHSW